MKFIRFVFSFLYVRNWYTGQPELSRARVVSLVCFVAFVLLSLGVAIVLQAPVTYQQV